MSAELANSGARRRLVVGIGEAMIVETAERTQFGGLALEAAIAAVKAGERGICISRVGQDEAGDDVLRHAREAGVDVAPMQTDPDLPTGRRVTRLIAGRTTTNLSAHAAFDNLQWDFDMIDIAQRAEVVIFGQLARRNGQSRSVINQFLAECTAAMRVFDLTNRARESVDRSDARSGIEFCDVLVAEEHDLRLLQPIATDAIMIAHEMVESEQVRIVFACARDGDHERWSVVSGDGLHSVDRPLSVHEHVAAVTRATIALLRGRTIAEVARDIALVGD